MNCTQIDRYLDAMMDGELTDDVLQAVESHCQGCVDCAEKLRATRQMMRMFNEMAAEMDVPLTTQADWRRAVQGEARHARNRRLYRYAGGIAAALVVAVGATFALKTPPKADMTVYMAKTAGEYIANDAAFEAEEDLEDGAEEAEALIESDGMAMIRMSAESMALSAPMHQLEMTVDDVDRICDYVQDLAAEYEGSVEIQRYDEDDVPCANLYIDLPGANADEFIRAITSFDQSGATPEPMAAGADGEVSILLVLKTK